MMVDVFDCSGYLICQSGRSERKKCSQGQSFDVEYFTCVRSENVDCSGRAVVQDSPRTWMPIGMSTHLGWQSQRPTRALPTRPIGNANVSSKKFYRKQN